MLRPLASATALGLLLCGCSTSPPSKFYTLSMQTPQDTVQWSDPVNISIERIWLPDIVDRSQFVLRIDQNQVQIDEFARWAEPLKEQIASVLAADLARSFPGAIVSASPQWGQDDKLYRVSVDVQNFESVPGGSATIAAVWTVRPR